MNTTTHNHEPAQLIAVQESEINNPKKGFEHYAVMLFAFAVLSVNFTHFYNYSFYSLYDSMADNYYQSVFQSILVGMFSYAEIPAVIVFAYYLRVKPKGLGTKISALIVLSVITLAGIAGSTSNNALDQDKKSQVRSWSSSMKALDSEEKSLISNYDTSVLAINKRGGNPIALSGLSGNLSTSLKELNNERASLERKRPFVASTGGGDWVLPQWFKNLFFSVMASIFGALATWYHYNFIRPKTWKPLVTLVDKISHDWNSDRDTFTAKKVEINPLRGWLSDRTSFGFVGKTKPEQAPQPTQQPSSAEPCKKIPLPYCTIYWKRNIF